MAECPCCSGKEYDECCGPLLKREADAKTAEALMRSRYTAFTMCDVDYIEQTRHPRSKDKFDESGVRHWAESSDWKGLEVLKTKAGLEDDDTGEVEFIARYAQDGEDEEHHERALFQKEDAKWYFVDGDAVLPETYVREAPKVGRNEPCPCGSGKKFKKCCGKR